MSYERMTQIETDTRQTNSFDRIDKIRNMMCGLGAVGTIYGKQTGTLAFLQPKRH